MEATEIIHCRGHPLVLGSHPTTFEITREDHLTQNGNCIVGIAADKGSAGLSRAFREVLSHDEAILTTLLECVGVSAELTSHGSSLMALARPADLVWRRSSFVCGRTIGILSDHVAATLPKKLIEKLVLGEEMVATLTARRRG